MQLLYYKRFVMEIDLRRHMVEPQPPPGFFFVPYDDNILELHARVHYESFCDELDSALFPCFTDPAGCYFLMREIRRHPGFCAEATWLLAGEDGLAGSVQGVVDRQGVGGIQNVGVVPAWRGRGLGTALIRQALCGFCRVGAVRARLEVTAENSQAIRLYQQLGFRKMKTLYKTSAG